MAETTPRRRMSKLEMVFREAVCPATLDNSVPDLEPAPFVEALMINGLSRRTSSNIRKSIMRSSATRKSLPPPPPDPADEKEEEVQQAIQAAAERRRASSLTRSATDIDVGMAEEPA